MMLTIEKDAVFGRTKFLNDVKEHLPASPIVCEVGVHMGDFARMILDILKPAHLILIDPYTKSEKTYGSYMQGMSVAYSDENDYSKLLQRFEVELNQKKVSVSRKFSYDAVHDIADNSLDLVYIDASHLYEDVKKDMEDYLPKLKPGGILAGHDYIHIEGFGVIQAVDEIMIRHGMEVIAFNGIGGDWALRKQK